MGKKTHQYLPKEIPRITKSKSPSKSRGNKTQNHNSLLVCNLRKKTKKNESSNGNGGCLNVFPVFWSDRVRKKIQCDCRQHASAAQPMVRHVFIRLILHLCTHRSHHNNRSDHQSTKYPQSNTYLSESALQPLSTNCLQKPNRDKLSRQIGTICSLKVPCYWIISSACW